MFNKLQEAILQCLHKELDMDNPMIHPKFSTEGLENCLSSNCLAHNVFGVRSYEQVCCQDYFPNFRSFVATHAELHQSQWPPLSSLHILTRLL